MRRWQLCYRQPVTREGVRAIRGADGVISSLHEKNLVREVGKEADRGQAILYATTALFLEHFGLKSLQSYHHWKTAPDEESKRIYSRDFLVKLFNA